MAHQETRHALVSMALWGIDNIDNVSIIQLFVGAFFYHSMLNRVPFLTTKAELRINKILAGVNSVWRR